MNQSIKLLFDKVSHGGLHGQTQNGEKILYNLKQVGQRWFDLYTDMLVSENKATMYFPTGRFLSIITASLDENKKYMMTFDLMNNPEGAKKYAEGADNDKDIFMAAFNLIKYEEDYYKFILTEGEGQNQVENV